MPGAVTFNEETLVVDGLAGLQRAFRRAGKEIHKDLRSTLQDAADPVAFGAQVLALTRISHMTSSWSEFRIGVTQREVYVVPKQRGVKARRDHRKRRPKFGDLLLDKAMEPSLKANLPRVEDNVNKMLVEFAHKWAATP